ncbi:MAG: hypothetical protein ABI175_19895 [Polyangiales bacterium]
MRLSTPSLSARLVATLACAANLAIGCGGSSSTPNPLSDASPPPAPTSTADTGTPPPPPAPVRALKTGNLLPTPAHNLLLDPNFAQDPLGWGHFYCFYEASLSSVVEFGLRTDSASPGGVSAPIVVVKDPTATDARSKGLRMISSISGGPGPYSARVWLSASDIAGNPTELPEGGATVAVTTTAVTKTFDIARTETLVIGDRTWVLFSATIADTLTAGGFFQIHLGKQGGGFRITAPELVPAALGPVSPKSFVKPALARPPTADERAAIDAYRRLPVALMAPPSRAPKPPPPPRF